MKSTEPSMLIQRDPPRQTSRVDREEPARHGEDAEGAGDEEQHRPEEVGPPDVAVLSLRGRLGTEKAEAVEIVGLYWHFVDVVWIVIFTIVYLISA